eukprot:666861-Pyramimonas_sp.AAC.1
MTGKKEFLSCVSRSLDPRHMTVFIGGDWNFCAMGEARRHVDPTLDRTPRCSLATEFGYLISRFTELGQENHTHCIQRNGSLVSTARIDRIYTSLPSSTILDLSPAAGVEWQAAEIRDVSDHVPVYAILAVPSP